MPQNDHSESEEEGVFLDNGRKYAVDDDLLTENEKELISLVEPFKNTAERVGLQINYDKTKALCMRQQDGNGIDIVIGQHNIEVEECKYLGTTITNDMKKVISMRIVAANRCYFSLMPTMKRRSVSWATKIRVYNTIIRPVILYASETWTLTKQMEQRSNVFEKDNRPDFLQRGEQMKAKTQLGTEAKLDRI